ncbi:glycosylated lysosomal membrane protein A [Hyalella azteca]|uniref:Glycosylated lysosomal membrane protein A n=1 Tax=Hyalella azteca TaxID=294128 RepID=A0A8B7NE37_HYAAZ|nr:glycosylated lysosomal membrane protein A [Hyalella azteca]
MENSFRVCMLFLLISNLLLSHGALGKNLTVTVNPDCSASTADCSLPWLVDVISRPSDSLNATQYHHVWGAVGAPTLMAIESPADAKLSVDWSLLASHQASAIQLQPAPLSVFGVAITEIILFDDVNDEGSIRNVNSSAQISLPSSLFDWNFTVSYTDSDVHVSFYTTHCNNTELEPNSGLYINLSASLEGRRSDDPPRLFCHASAAAVDFILDNLILNVTNPNPSD